MDSQGTHILMIMFGRSVGGAELQFLELANYLSQKHQVRLLCLAGDGALQAATVSQEIDVRVYPYKSRFTALIGLLRTWLGNLFYPADVIVCTSFIGNLVGLLIGLFKRAKRISLQTVSVCMGRPIIDRFVLRRFDVLVAGANDIKTYLIGHGMDPGQVRVVHNWVDFSRRVPSRSAQETRKQFTIPTGTVIGCIGRLHPQKGQEYLVRAFSEVVQQHSHAVLLLIGDGPTRKELEDEIRDLGLAGKVIFTGTITGEDYNNLLSIIDIYVQPSVFEGLPRTLLDAMYLRKTIIATSINGNKEAVQHERNGLLVPAKDVPSLAAALEQLMLHPVESKRLATQAKRTAEESFGMDSQLLKIENMMTEAQAEK